MRACFAGRDKIAFNRGIVDDGANIIPAAHDDGAKEARRNRVFRTGIHAAHAHAAFPAKRDAPAFIPNIAAGTIVDAEIALDAIACGAQRLPPQFRANLIFHKSHRHRPNFRQEAARNQRRFPGQNLCRAFRNFPRGGGIQLLGQTVVIFDQPVRSHAEQRFIKHLIPPAFQQRDGSFRRAVIDGLHACGGFKNKDAPRVGDGKLLDEPVHQTGRTEAIDRISDANQIIAANIEIGVPFQRVFDPRDLNLMPARREFALKQLAHGFRVPRSRKITDSDLHVLPSQKNFPNKDRCFNIWIECYAITSCVNTPITNA